MRALRYWSGCVHHVVRTSASVPLKQPNKLQIQRRSVQMVERRAKVVGRLKALEEIAAPLIHSLQNPNEVQEFRANKQHNLQMLSDHYQIGQGQIEALYQNAKFQFECGSHSGAADYSYRYWALSTDSKRSLSALWAKLAAEILMQN